MLQWWNYQLCYKQLGTTSTANQWKDWSWKIKEVQGQLVAIGTGEWLKKTWWWASSPTCRACLTSLWVYLKPLGGTKWPADFMPTTSSMVKMLVATSSTMCAGPTIRPWMPTSVPTMEVPVNLQCPWGVVAIVVIIIHQPLPTLWLPISTTMVLTKCIVHLWMTTVPLWVCLAIDNVHSLMVLVGQLGLLMHMIATMVTMGYV